MKWSCFSCDSGKMGGAKASGCKLLNVFFSKVTKYFGNFTSISLTVTSNTILSRIATEILQDNNMKRPRSYM